MSHSFTNATTLDDTSSNITYSGTWVQHDNIPSGYNLYHNTDAWSDEQGATATLTFYGTSVDYWGDQEYTRGPCEVAIDGAVVTTVNANAPVVTGDVIQLFTSGNLPLGQHTLVIKVDSALSANRCEIDRFVVSTSINLTPTPTPPASSIASSISASTPVPMGSSPSAIHATSGGSTSLHSTSTPTISGVGIFVSLPVSTVTIPVSANVAETSTMRSKSSVSVGIIGGTFGAIVLVGLFVFLWWWLYKRPGGVRKRRFKRFHGSGSEDYLDADGLPDPFAPLPHLTNLANPPRMKGMEDFGLVPSLPNASHDPLDYRRPNMDEQGHSNHSQFSSAFVASTETVVMPAIGSRAGISTTISTISESRPSIETEDCPPAYHET